MPSYTYSSYRDQSKTSYTIGDIRTVYDASTTGSSAMIESTVGGYKATKDHKGSRYASRQVQISGGEMVTIPEFNFVGYSDKSLELIDKAYVALVQAIEGGELTGSEYLQMLKDTSAAQWKKPDGTEMVGQSIYSLSGGGAEDLPNTSVDAGGITDGDRGATESQIDGEIETVIFDGGLFKESSLEAADTAQLISSIFHEPLHRNYVHSQNFIKPGGISGNLDAITAADVAADYAYRNEEALMRIIGEDVDPKLTDNFLDDYYHDGGGVIDESVDEAVVKVYENSRVRYIARLISENWENNRASLGLTGETLRRLEEDKFLKYSPGEDVVDKEAGRDDAANYEIGRKTERNYDEPEPDADGALRLSVPNASDDGSGQLFIENFRDAVAAIRDFFGEYSSEIGAALGSNLGRILFDGGEVQAEIGAILLGTVGRNIGEQIELELNATSLAKEADEAFSNFLPDIRDAAVGALSSYLTAELVEALGLEGDLAAFSQAVAGATIGKIADNLANGVTWTDGVNMTMVATAAGSFIGTMVARELVEFDTISGQIGASIGSTVGVAIGVEAFAGAAMGAKMGAAVGAAIGAFIGYIVGGLIGTMFGSAPRSQADLGWSGDRFFVARVSWKAGASIQVAHSLGESAAGILNGVLAATGSNLVDGRAVRTGAYGTYKKWFVYRATGGTGAGDITFWSKDSAEVIDHGIAIAVSDMLPRLVGGDVFMKRAIAATLLQAGVSPTDNYAGAAGQFEAATLLGNLAIADDYATYMQDAQGIKLVIAAAPESSIALGWIATFAKVLELGLDRRWSTDWSGGWTAYLDQQLDGRLDGVAFTPANLDLSFASGAGERRFTLLDADGDILAVLGDTIDTPSKDIVWGNPGSDVITVAGDQIANTSGLTINGAASSGAALDIRVAAVIDADAGDDVVTAGDLGNDVIGGAGNDTLVGGVLDDWLFGGSGNDRLFAGAANWQFTDGNAAGAAAAIGVAGGNGNLLDGGDGDDALYGSTGSDWLRGGAGVDLIYGGAGGDVLAGDAGNDGGPSGEARLFGGAGTDQYVFGYGDGVDVLFDESDNSATPGATGDTIFNRVTSITQGSTPRNWAGGGDYEVDGSVKGGEDAVVFGPGITLQDITLSRSGTQAAPGHDLIISLTAINPASGLRVPTGDQLVLKDWFEPTRRVEWLRFADGQEIRISDLSSFVAGSSGPDIIVGTYLADFLVGGDGNDTIRGLAGDDFGFGGAGRDVVAGDEDNDWVSGGSDDDHVLGGLGNDTVFGDAGADEIYGSGGHDILAGGRGNDQVVGGAGNDIFRFSRGDGRDTVLDEYVNNWDLVWQNNSYVNGYVLDPQAGTVSKGGTVVFDGTQWLGLFDFTDSTQTFRRHLGPVSGVMAANAGGDVLEFGVGIDIQDLMLRRTGADLEIAIGLGDNDARSFDEIGDRVTFKDWYALNKPIETFVFASTGAHALLNWAMPGTGTEGNDTISGTSGADWITGNGGDDTITGAGGNDVLAGNGGGDTLNGGNGDDVLYGGDADDVLIGGAGADVLIGGAGLDIASYTGSSTGMRAFLNAPSTNTQLGVGDVYSGIEGLEGTSGADTLGGDFAGNVLRGAGGSDVLYGGAGDDIYEIDTSHGTDVILDAPFTTQGATEVFTAGDGGVDTLDFGAGIGLSDLSFSWQNGGADLRVTYATTHWVTIQNQNDPNRAIESIQLRDGLSIDLAQLRLLGEAATSGADFLVGSTVANTLDGLGGDDVISGLAGNDTLRGNDGDDVLEGAAGSDTLDGGNDSVTAGGTPALGDQLRPFGDTIRYVRSTAAVNIDLAARTASGGHAQGDIIFAVANVATVENVVGSEGFGDTLRGDARANRLFGLGGNDTLDGRAGNDVLGGGLGNDNLQGGDGDDNLAGQEGDDTLAGGNGVDLLAGDAGVDNLNGDAGDDVVSGGQGNDTVRGGADNDEVGGDDGVDQVYGDAGNDRLAGGAGDDSLFGGDGADALSGGTGNDQLRGEAGDDTYAFDAASGSDLVIDSAGTNRIVIAGGVRIDQVWLTRVADDLRIGVIGGSTTITVQGYYAAASPSLVREVALEGQSLFLAAAQPLIQAMTQSTTITPVEMPHGVAQMLGEHWDAGGKSAPVVSDQDLVTNEDTPLAGSIGATDHDQNITSYTLAEDALVGAVALNGATGTWTYTPNANFHGSDSFSILVTDADNHQVTQTVDVSIASVNDAPSDVVLTGAPATIPERDHPVTGTVLNAIALGTLSAVDVDAPDSGDFASHVFSITDSRFEIVNGNQLQLRAGVALDFEATPTVTLAVTATDRNGAGLSYTKNLTFNVQDLDDYFYGTAGNDTITGGAGRNIIAGFGGNDTLNGAGANDSIDGGDGADQVFGNGGDDTLDGAFGDDVLEGGAGADTVHGGDGFDTVRGGDGADQLFGDVGNDTLQGGLLDDQLDGGTGNDRLEGEAGNDRLVGGSEDDTLIGGAGADRFLGGAGFDTVSYETATGAVTVNLGTGTGTTGDAAGDIFEDVPERLVGTAYNDSLTGSAGSDTIDGGAGNDTILGGAGNDTLNGGDGNDTIDAQWGNDTLNGGTGSDVLIGGDDSDVYLMDVNSGADEIQNYDPNGTDIDAIGYQNIANSQLWFERSVDDLIVTVVGTSTRTTIKNWYITASPGDRSNYKIDFFLAGNHTSQTINAEALVALMAGYTRPTTQAQYDALHANSTFENSWGAAWNPNAPPVVPAIATQAINEDGTLTLSVTITDDYTPHASVTVTAQAVSPSNYNVTDLSLVNAPTVGASDANGTRTLTVITKPNTSGQVAIKVQATDAGGLLTERVFLLNISPVADTPAVTAAQAAAPVSPILKPTLDSGSWALSVQGALVDQDGSETLEVRIANVPSGLSFNAGTNLGGGVWSFTPAQLTGLRIQGPASWSQDLALSVTAVSRETATGQTATSAATALNFQINARPTDIVPDRTLAFAENLAPQGLAWLGRTDADSGDTATYSLVSGGGGALTVRSDGLLSSAVAFNYEAQTSYSITVRVTDSGGLSYDETLTVGVTNVNEAPHDLWPDRTLAFNENLPAQGLAWFGRSDVDAGDTATYSLVSGGGGALTVRSDGLLSSTVAFNADAQASYSITVRVTDAGGLSYDEAFTVAVNNLNEAATITQNASFSLTEGTGGAGVHVATIVASDQDGPVTYELVGGGPTDPNNPEAFTINASGQLMAQKTMNFEDKSSYAVRILTRDSVFPSQPTEHTINITVVDVEEPPTISFAPKASGTGGGTYVGTATAVDPDLGNVFYELYSPVTQLLAQWSTGPYGFMIPGTYWEQNVTVSGAYITSDGHLYCPTNFWTGMSWGDYENGGGWESWGTYDLYVRARDAEFYYSPWVHVQFNGDGFGTTWATVVPPVVLDLDGDGLELVSVNDSNVVYAMSDEEPVIRTGWVAADDALLALDRDGDGAIAGLGEISFVGDAPGAASDLEGLAAFDTDLDGSLDADDADFADFLVWQDRNQDGVSQADELSSLSESGIVSIGLARRLTGNAEGTGDNVVTATAEMVRADGSVGVVGDVLLAYHAAEITVTYDEAPPGYVEPPRSVDDGAASVEAEQYANEWAGWPVSSFDGTPIDEVDRRANGDSTPIFGVPGPADIDSNTPTQEDAAQRTVRETGPEGTDGPEPDQSSVPRPARPRSGAAESSRDPWKYEASAVEAPSALHSRLDTIARRRLQMIDAMATFSAEGAAAIELQPHRRVDPHTLEWLTAVSGVRPAA